MKTQQKENKNSKVSCVTLSNNIVGAEDMSNTLSQSQKDFIDSRLNHYYNNPNDLMDFDDLLEK